MSDWIKIHRRLLNSDVWENPQTLKVWMWLLLKANYKDKQFSIKIGAGFEDVLVKRGKVLFGRKTAAKELKLSESATYRSIKKLSSIGKITVKSNSHYSIITICKYEHYQSVKEECEQQPNSNRTTTEQHLNTTKKVKNIEEGKEEYSIPSNSINETSIVGKMKIVWMKYNPTYQMEVENDCPSLLSIAYKIAKSKGWEQKEVMNGKLEQTIVSWEIISKFIKEDDFYRKLELKTIDKRWTGLYQSMASLKNESGKVQYSNPAPKTQNELDIEMNKWLNED